LKLAEDRRYAVPRQPARRIGGGSMHTAFLFVLLLVIASKPALADGSVSSMQMGDGARTSAEFKQFQFVIQQYNTSGERFRIDSRCQSACTMFLSIRNVCVLPSATLSFHAGGSPAYTAQMLGTYNFALQQYVSANHYMNTPEFHTISGREIMKRFGYRACR
jgi:hypothetical protein